MNISASPHDVLEIHCSNLYSNIDKLNEYFSISCAFFFGPLVISPFFVVFYGQQSLWFVAIQLSATCPFLFLYKGKRDEAIDQLRGIILDMENKGWKALMDNINKSFNHKIVFRHEVSGVDPNILSPIGRVKNGSVSMSA